MSSVRFRVMFVCVLVVALMTPLQSVLAASVDQDVTSRLETEQRWLQGTEEIALKLTLVNTGKAPAFVLRWLTPIDGIEHNIFKVSRDGEAVTYTGILAKRPLPQPEDFIKILPGEEISFEFDPSDSYDMTQRGEYTLRYQARIPAADLAKAARTERMPLELVSNEIVLWSDGIGEGYARPELPALDKASLTYERCTTSQMAILQTAHANATSISGASVNHLAANPGGSSLYTQWFGAYTSTRFNTVEDHFDAIYDAFQNAPTTYNCKCKKPYFAYVYPTQPYRIYVCRVFWQVSPLGRDSQAGTLVHEMSHFTVVASTTDYVYGATGAMDLAATDPDKAIFNADNHEYFAEDQ